MSIRAAHSVPIPHARPAGPVTAPEVRVPAVRILGVLAVRPVLILALGLTLLAAGAHLLWANVLVVVVDIATLVLVHRALRAEGRSLLDLVRPWRWRDLAWGALLLVLLVIGFLVCSVLANLLVHGGPPPMPVTTDLSLPLWAGLVGILVAPLSIALAEEALYRGYAQPRLARTWGTPLALVSVAVVFGVQHVGFALTSPADAAAKVLTTLLAGLLLGALMLWMRRIAPLVVAHWGLDVVGLGLPMLLIALS